MKIVTIVGARPQFIKLAPLSEAMKRMGHIEYAIHTGQHFDYMMSEEFYKELAITTPNINLNVSKGTITQQLGKMIEHIGAILLEQKPRLVMVFGDTTSTLAGALAANKVGCKIVHIEAGIRSFNRIMPEEHNRVITDHISDLLFCPTLTATKNLVNEGVQGGIFFTGDITYDVILDHMGKVSSSDILDRLHLSPKSYSILTIHRSYNLDNPYALSGIMTGLEMSGRQIIFPMHPHTQQVMKSQQTKIPANVTTISPVGYVEMLSLEKNAIEVITDSGGMQKEAYWFSTPCVTLRTETEWPETTYSGWNVLVSSNPVRIYAALSGHIWPTAGPLQIFGNGNSAKSMMDLIDAYA